MVDVIVIGILQQINSRTIGWKGASSFDLVVVDDVVA